MFGKFFASTFTGSMFGAGADVFAVWGYVIAHAVASQVELNPRVLAATIGMTPERAELAIAALCAPDPKSRSKAEDGRRLIQEGEYAYRVTNHDKYRLIRHEEDRREYNRDAQRRYRAKKKKAAVNAHVIDSQSLSTVSAQAEAEAEAETENITTTAARARVISALGDSPDLVAVCKMAGNPEALCMEIMALLDGMHGTPPTVGAVRMALRDMAITGNRPSGKMLRAFVRKAGEPDATTGGGYTGYQEFK